MFDPKRRLLNAGIDTFLSDVVLTFMSEFIGAKVQLPHNKNGARASVRACEGWGGGGGGG